MGRKRIDHTPRTAGVYLIWNNQTMKFYIGSSNNIYKRFTVHKAEMKSGAHKNPELLADFRTYGLDAFEFLIVKEFDRVEDAHACEKQLIEEFAYKELLYNFVFADKPKTPHSQETKARISEIKKGKQQSQEHRANISRAKKGKERSKNSAEHNARISEGLKLRHAKRRQASVDVSLTCASV